MNVCVCDIGGGTIDTQTLELLALNPLKAKESCVGTGHCNSQNYRKRILTAQQELW